MHTLHLFLTLVLVVSPLLVHEMGHWAVLRANGCPVQAWHVGLGPDVLRWGRVRVGLFPLGMAVAPEPVAYFALPPHTRLSAAAAGPALSLAYAALLLDLSSGLAGAEAHGLGMLAAISLGIGVFNLIPLPPLDGFAMVQAHYEKKGDPLSPRFVALSARMGNGLLYGVGFLVVGLSLVHG